MSEQKIKCVIWDLDNTVWNGVLIEDKEVTITMMQRLSLKNSDYGNISSILR